MANLTRRGVLGACAAAITVPLWSCATRKEEFVQRTVFCFDTVCTLGGAMLPRVLDQAEAQCARYEQLFSRTIATSDVARINAANGAWVEVDSLTAELVGLSLAYCEESQGLFDITVGAVSELWDFVEGVIPSKKSIDEAIKHVDWKKVEVRNNSIRLLDPNARIDLGGIAKGFIADKLIDLFVRNGATDAFVNLGGNVKVLGHSQKGEPWSIGVRDPRDNSGNSIVAKTNTTDGSLVTSGLYERSFERDGKRYWHILDPRTGYPVQTDLMSASIFSKKSIDGDGYTKPLFMLGQEEALAFVERRKGLEALLVKANNSIVTTNGARFELV